MIEPEDRIVGGDVLVGHGRPGRDMAAIMRLDGELLVARAAAEARIAAPADLAQRGRAVLVQVKKDACAWVCASLRWQQPGLRAVGR